MTAAVGWMVASVLALTGATGADVARAAPEMTPHAWTLLACLTAAVGSLHGLITALTIHQLRALPAHARMGVVFAVATMGGVYLAERLGAFARLTGRYWQLAYATLAASLLAACLLGGLLLMLVPSATHPRGLLSRVRVWVALPLAVTAALVFVADNHYLKGLYPLLHAVLRWSVVTLGSCGLWLSMPRVVSQSPSRVAAFTPIVASAAAIAVAALYPSAVFPLELAPWSRVTLTTARALTDIDLDGYSSVLAGGDCAPLSPRVNPGAREIPDNGIDDNCLLDDAHEDSEAESQVDDNAPLPRQDIVLITIDTLRADRLGIYNEAHRANGLATTPNIDAWAEQGTFVFERAYTAGALTSIALPAMMRGLFPRRLRWSKSYETSRFRLLHTQQEIDALTKGETIIKMFPVARRDRHASLASRLRQRGMQTLAVVDDGFCEQLNPGSGLADGFDEYRRVDDLSAHARGDVGTTNLALHLLEQTSADKPFFLWVHYFGAHGPDTKHPGVRIDGSSLAQSYDHQVRFVDQQVGRLLTALQARTEPPIVVLTADHGEDLSGSARHHGFSLKESVIQVPLLVRAPNARGRRIATPVSLVDIMPSVLAWTHTQIPAGLDGKPLQTTLATARRQPRELIADVWQYDRGSRRFYDSTTAFDGRRKVLYDSILSSWTIERQGEEPRAKRVAADADIATVRALADYVEQTGGDLPLSD